MAAKVLPRNRLIVDDGPLNPPDNRGQVFPQKRPEVKDVRQPPQRNRQGLQNEGAHHDAELAAQLLDWGNPPRHKGRSTAGPADLEVIADPFVPAKKPTFKYPAAEVVDLVPRSRAWPSEDRILSAERVVSL